MTADLLAETVSTPLLSAGDLPAPGGWRSALYRPDAPGAALDGQEWARSWPSFMRAVTDVNDGSARQYIARVMNAAGMSERLPGGGGFLVPEVLRSQVLAFMTGAIVRPRAMILPMAAERLSVPVLDNLTQASGTQVLGGLTFSWAEEGAGITPSIPSFGRTVLEARKAAAYLQGIDNGFVDDAAGAFGDFMARVLSLGWAWAEDDFFFNGTGVGEPQGILNAPCAVAVTRTNSGQAAIFADIVAMFRALHPGIKQHGLTSGVTSVAWLLSASVIDALVESYLNVGGASAPSTITPVAPPGWFSMGDGDKITPSLLGLPAIVTDHQPASGSVGDVALCDISKYLIGDRLAMTIERSTESPGAFGSDASNFRVKSRLDGRYWIQSATVTEANQSVSPIVVLHLWGLRMPGSQPCPPGCDCWKHNRPRLSREELNARQRDRHAADPEKYRERSRANYADNPGPYRERASRNARAAREANPEKVRKQSRERQRTYHDAHADEINQRKRDRRAKDPQRTRGQRDFGRHGLRPEDRARKWAGQEGRCCYCGDELSREPKKVHVDHDHTCCPPDRSCGYCQRGLACANCNHVVGHGLDDPDRLERIAANLRRLKAEARERIAGKPVQGELLLNVVPFDRDAKGA